jgi:hypothetical protein
MPIVQQPQCDPERLPGNRRRHVGHQLGFDCIDFVRTDARPGRRGGDRRVRQDQGL